jgi:membrane protease YdiL (CAAX protease family)
MNTSTDPSVSNEHRLPVSDTNRRPVYGYHRLQRCDASPRWWRPLVVGLLAAGLYVGTLVVIAVIVIVVGLAVPSMALAASESWDGDVDLGNPVTFALLLGSLVLMLPALLIATRLKGSHPVGLLSSVTGRLRFRWLWTATVLAFAVWAPVMAVWVTVEAATGTLQVRHVAPGTTLTLLLVTLALVPFQAAAEEYVFRGYLAQLVGSWLRHPAFAVLLPVPLFIAGHGYGTLGSVDVGAFAVMCGWLAYRTGGLEAPIALHVANNVVLMSISALGFGDPNATDTSLLGLGVSLAMMAVFTVLVTRRADALGIARTRLVTPLTEASVTADPAAGTSPHVEVGGHTS